MRSGSFFTRKATPPAPPATSRSERALREFHEENDVPPARDLRLIVRLWPFLRPQRPMLVASLGAVLVLAVLALVRPLIMRAGFDATSMGSAAGLRNVFRAGVLLAGLLVVEQLLSFVQTYWLQLVGARAMATLREHVFQFLHTRGLPFFDQQPIGRLVTRVTNDVDAIGEAFGSGALNAVGDILKLVGIVVMMLVLDAKLALIAFAALPPVWLLVDWVRRRARVAFREIRRKTARLNAFLGEQVAGMAITQAYGREAATQCDFDEINVTYRDANFRSIALESTLDAAVEMVSSLCIAAVISYAGIRPFGHVVTFGTLVAFIAYLEQFFGPIRDLSSRYTQLQSALTGAERVFLLLDNEDEDAPQDLSQKEVESLAGAVISSSHRATAPALELDRVTFSYKADTPVLRDLTFAVRPGERVALIGPTGSGKSTIAGLFLRLYDVGQPGVRVFGREVTSLERHDLRRHFSVVPQDVFLFPGTIADNIAVGDAAPNLPNVEQALATLGLSDWFQDREGGLLSRVDERGSNFSAGERQLIAFARAVYRDAPILILDEATANVDSNTEGLLQIALERLLAGRTALLIAHRLSTIRAVDRILVLRQGELAESGTHDELIRRDGLYARLYDL